jgi:hypothetical protein
MNTVNKIFLILILLSFTKCESDSVRTLSISENVVIILSERFSDNQKKEFYIRFGLLQNCHCVNEGHLDYRFVRYGHSFDFKLKEIQIPDDCNDSFGSPFAETNLGALENGEYEIKVKVRSDINSGTLTVTDTSYCLTMTNIRNVELRGSHFRRIFENTLWGGFCYSTDAELEMGLSLVDSLKVLGVHPTTLEFGDYFFFTFFDGKPDLRMYGYVPHYYVNKEIGFIFDYNFSDDKIKNLMDKYKNLGGNLYIKVATGKGLSLYNWR